MKRNEMLADDLQKLSDYVRRGEVPSHKRTGQAARITRIVIKLGLNKKAVQKSWHVKTAK